MENIRLYRLLLLDEAEFDRYFGVFEHIKPVDRIGNLKAKRLQSLTFGEVLTIKKCASKNDYIEPFLIVFGISKRKLLMTRVTDFFRAFNWIRNELTILIEREKLLNSEPEPKMIEAGIERLDLFKEMNLVIPLSKDYSLHPDEIFDWRYSTIFTLLHHGKMSAEIDRNYAEILRKSQAK